MWTCQEAKYDTTNIYRSWREHCAFQNHKRHQQLTYILGFKQKETHRRIKIDVRACKPDVSLTSQNTDELDWTMLYDIQPHQVENSNKCRFTKKSRCFLHVNIQKIVKTIPILTYTICFTSHKLVVVTPNDKRFFLRGFRSGPKCFQPKPLSIANLAFFFPCSSHSSFKSNFAEKNGAHVCFLKCLEGDGFRNFNFFAVILYK